jgi:hypothetical protein
VNVLIRKLEGGLARKRRYFTEVTTHKSLYIKNNCGPASNFQHPKLEVDKTCMFCDIPIITCVIHGKWGCVPEAFFSSFPHSITNFTYSYVSVPLEYSHYLVLNTFGGAPQSNPLHT